MKAGDLIIYLFPVSNTFETCPGKVLKTTPKKALIRIHTPTQEEPLLKWVMKSKLEHQIKEQ